ncbi:MAG: hypothetical protein LUO82_06585 [Methanomicrobiales archaeon]|nr:hypothetical protein [Methanomicrobiales archaeon]
MQLEELRNIILNERESARLSEIPPDVFQITRHYLDELQEKVYHAKDPLSEETRAVIEEIFSLRDTVQEIFQIRSRKILGLASARMEHGIDREEIKKMLPPEATVYRKILDALEEARAYYIVAGEQLPIAEREGGGESARLQKITERPACEQMVVRMLTDVDSFMGVDGRIYTLKKEDVVTLPTINGEVLCDHHIALNIRLIT